MWSPDLASRCNLSHKGRSGRSAKRKHGTWVQGTCVIDGPLLLHPCIIRLRRLRAWIHSRPRRAILLGCELPPMASYSLMKTRSPVLGIFILTLSAQNVSLSKLF